MSNRANRRRQKKLAKKGPPIPPAEFDAQMRNALALHQAGNLSQAEMIYRQVLNAAPDHVHALNLLGAAIHQSGRHEEAIHLFEKALGLAPLFPEAQNNLASAFLAVGRNDDALAAIQRAIKAAPELPNARRTRATALLRLRRYNEAISDLKEITESNPTDAGAHNDLGAALYETGELETALAAFDEAIDLAPDLAEVHNNRGSVLNDLGRPGEAVASLEQAVALKSEFADAWVNLGNAHQAIGERSIAREAFEKALALKNDHPQAHMNRGLILLVEGELRSGWPEYEWRWRTPDMLAAQRHSNNPLWDGSPLDGSTILLHAEQGFGDTIQFIRYADIAHQRGGKVIVECQEPLRRLLAEMPTISEVVAQDQPAGAFDVQAPLLALPGILRTTLETIPSPDGYLNVPGSVEISGSDNPSIGLLWRGNPGHRNDHNRSLPGHLLETLVQSEGLDFYCLQYGEAADEVLNEDWAVHVADMRRQMTDFLATAKIVSALDLVITADTSVAHLAGALGRPVWTLLPHVPDWRWLLDREDSPWYSSMRLFRQSAAGDWESVITDVCAALGDWTSGPPSTI